uniref:LIM zinc-binding domain-containing protein n=1 Tax=Medicago truncatula TaxID=3880 RepID=I3SJA0_MEDTR|nr:unknown [Medicago truncatula]
MPNPKCAICNKTAYPLESVKALDQVYHKLCFRCSVCGITLNLKNFKGLEGKIYCAVHTPVSRSTATADAVSVQTALKAPKKKAESLGGVHQGDAVTAVGPAGEIVHSYDQVQSSGDQSTSYEPEAHVAPQDSEGYNTGPIVKVPIRGLDDDGAAAPAHHEEQHYEEEAGEEQQYDEGDY